MKLSILICSLNRREKYLTKLMRVLSPQINEDVEIITDIDDGEKSIGQKRNDLIKRAAGDYIAFIDDDDLVTSDYVPLILEGIKTSPDVIGMKLIMYTDGQNPQKSHHSIKYSSWYDTPDPVSPRVKRLYYRNPNHLNPVKREHALLVSFPEINNGEDRVYSKEIFPLLKTEVFIEKPIYMYLVRSRKDA